MESKLTSQQLMDKFVQTYSDLYCDICEYSTQEQIPLAVWLLGPDFKKVTSYELINDDSKKNPFILIKDVIKRDKPTAYVMGGTAIAVKRTIRTGQSTDKDINSKWTDDGPLGGVLGTDDPAANNFSYEDVANDPNKIESLLIATSVVNLPSKIQFADDELTTNDNLTMYIVNRTKNGATLTTSAESGLDKMGNTNLVNVLGKQFGLRRK